MFLIILGLSLFPRQVATINYKNCYIIIFESILTAVVNAFGQLHVFYDCMPNPNDISSQTGVCHLFYMDGAASFEVLDATWRYKSSIQCSLLVSSLTP